MKKNNTFESQRMRIYAQITNRNEYRTTNMSAKLN